MNTGSKQNVVLIASKYDNCYRISIEFEQIMLLKEINVVCTHMRTTQCIENPDSIEPSNTFNFLFQHGWPSKYFKIRVPFNLITPSSLFCLEFTKADGARFATPNIQTESFFMPIGVYEVNEATLRIHGK